MRPPRPVPFTCARLTPFSLASLRTSGEERIFWPSAVTSSSSSCTAGAAGAGVAGAAACAGADGAATGTAAGALAAPPMRPTTEFTWTVVPAWALISVSTPLAGAGISASTLSVEISNSGSSRWTLSPTFFSHFVMVPSKMDSPIWGITMSVAGPLAATGAGDGGAAAGALVSAAVGAEFLAAGVAGVATADPAASITPTTVFT